MNVFASVQLDTDIPFWIPRDEFFRAFDQKDFNLREVQNVKSAYSPEWFYTVASRTYFRIPAVQLISGHTQFISGRHRTAVLLRSLDEVPVAFDTRFGKLVPSNVTMRSLALSQPFILPDLPFLVARQGGA